MCTVSFIPLEDRAVITSNRDEHSSRATALFPKVSLVNGKQLLLPKDPQGGGTWFAIQQDKAVVVLLNGAEEKHEPNPPYRKSRGLIVLEMASSDNPESLWEGIDLDKIEPFTMVLFFNGELSQLRWNGSEKNKQRLSAQTSHFWSSSTLYSEAVRDQRHHWFQNFLQFRDVSEDSILDFHKYTNEEDQENGLVINRKSGIRTQSICQAVCELNRIELMYEDLPSKKSKKINAFTV